jgi:hypothetical protein
LWLLWILLASCSVASAAANSCPSGTAYMVNEGCNVKSFECRACDKNAMSYCDYIDPRIKRCPFDECPPNVQKYIDEICVCKSGFFSTSIQKYRCGTLADLNLSPYSGNPDNIYPYPDLFYDLFECSPCPIGKYCPGGANVEWLPKLLPSSGIGGAWRGRSHTAPIDCPNALMIAKNDHSGCVCPSGYNISSYPNAVANTQPSSMLPVDQLACRCPRGQYWNKSNNSIILTCGLCPRGSYCDDGLYMKQCPAGWDTPVEGGVALYSCSKCTSTSDCKQGEYCSPPTKQNVSFSCLLCPMGYFCALPTSPPQPCPAGTYQQFRGSSSCTKCSKGTFSNQIERTTPCDFCPPGHYQKDDEHVQCIKCIPGYYQPEFGALECKICETGKYQPLPGSTSCISCPAGYATSSSSISGLVPSSNLNDACEQCGPGKFTSLQRSTDDSLSVVVTCAQCPRGKYMPLSGQAACFPCSETNVYMTSDLGSTSIQQCRCDSATSYAAPGTGICTPCSTCGKGTYMSTNQCGPATNGKCTACNTCPFNTYVHPDSFCTGLQPRYYFST